MPAELTSTKAPAPVTPAPEGVLEAFVACLILSPVMAALYWQTYYAILRYNYFHQLVDWDTAQRLGLLLTLTPTAGCLILLLVIVLRRMRVHKALKIAAVLVPPMSLLLLAAIWVTSDPSWGARGHQAAINDASRYDIVFYHNETDSPERLAADKEVSHTFFLTGLDIPSETRFMSIGGRLIIACSRKEFPDTGVVATTFNGPWRYYCRGRVVAFANGHVDLVPATVFAAVWNDNNNAREELGLHPRPLPAPDR